MPITLQCSCGKQFKVLDDLAGKRVKCPGCQETVSVPATAKATELDEIDEGEGEGEDDDSPAPRKKKKKQRPESGSKVGLWIGLAAGVVGLSCCCLGLGVGGFFLLRKTPERTMIGRWQMDVNAQMKNNPGFLLMDPTTPTIEFRADGTVTRTMAGVSVNGSWKHVETKGDTVIIDIDSQRATVTIIDGDHMRLDGPGAGMPSTFFKRLPGS